MTIELFDDGDTWKVNDTQTLRLRIECDKSASINDYNSDGKIEWATGGYGQDYRPEGFTRVGLGSSNETTRTTFCGGRPL